MTSSTSTSYAAEAFYIICSLRGDLIAHGYDQNAGPVSTDPWPDDGEIEYVSAFHEIATTFLDWLQDFVEDPPCECGVLGYELEEHFAEAYVEVCGRRLCDMGHPICRSIAEKLKLPLKNEFQLRCFSGDDTEGFGPRHSSLRGAMNWWRCNQPGCVLHTYLITEYRVENGSSEIVRDYLLGGSRFPSKNFVDDQHSPTVSNNLQQLVTTSNTQQNTCPPTGR